MPDIVVSFLPSFTLWIGHQMPLVTLPTTSEKKKKKKTTKIFKM